VPGDSSSAGGGGIGGDCPCDPGPHQLLTVKCCSEGCKIDCGDASPSLKFVACGGRPPYTWTTTKGTIAISSDGHVATFTPDANTAPGTAGTAFFRVTAGLAANILGDCDPLTGALYYHTAYGCDSAEEVACHSQASTTHGVVDFTGANQCVAIGQESFCGANSCAGTCQGIVDIGTIFDARTASMITAGCNPCEVASEGAVITATDALGVSVATVVNG